MNRFALDDAGRLHFHLAELVGIDGTLAVNRLADGVHNPADERLAHRHLNDPVGTLYGVPFLDMEEVAENRGADVVLLEVEHHPGHSAGELQEFTRHGLIKTVNTGNTVTNRDNGAGLGNLHLFSVPLDLLSDYLADLFRSDFHRTVSPLL